MIIASINVSDFMNTCRYLGQVNFKLFEVLYLRKENRCLHTIRHGSMVVHSLSMHKLLNEWLAELPAILDSFFWRRQYQKHSYHIIID